MRDLQPFGAGALDIYLAVAARIDDRCFALRTDQIGKVRKAGGLYLLKQHILPRCWNVSASPHRSRSEEHTSELQSLMRISYAVFCLKKKKTVYNNSTKHT